MLAGDGAAIERSTVVNVLHNGEMEPLGDGL